MKLSKDYKKPWRKILLLLCLVIACGLFVHASFAQTVDELQGKISEKNNDIARLEQEIRAYQSELNTISVQKNSLANQIKQLDVTKKKLTADISLTEEKIS